MRDEREVTHVFECPECGEDLEVNEPMKEALVETGCVTCGATVTTAAFMPTSPSDSS